MSCHIRIHFVRDVPQPFTAVLTKTPELFAALIVGFQEVVRSKRVGRYPLCPAGHLPHKEGDRQDVLPPLHS